VETDNDFEMINIGTQFLEAAKRNLDDESIVISVKAGDLNEHITLLVDKGDVDMVVIGSHYRKGLERIFSGNLVEKIIQHSAVPVVVVPLPDIQELS
jgi:nucleotide-binding universal stress UspA family protein